DVTAPDEASMDARYRALPRQETLERMPAEDEHDLWFDQRQLASQVGRARLALVGHRVAVLRGPALEHVGDVDVGAAEADSGQQRVQQMAGCADERFALPVLVEAGCLADDHDVGRAGPHARDSLRARRVETALD